MNIKTKIVAVLAIASLIVPAGVIFAQTTPTTANLQAQIAALLAQVQQLEAQLAAQGGTSTVVWCYNFTGNLSIGMSGTAVSGLQTALQKDGESVTVTGTFDDQTAAAVTGFQEKYASAILAPYGLSNGTGYVGAATRAKLNALFGCNGTNPIPTPPITPCPAWGCGPAPTPIVNLPVSGTPSITVLSPNGGEVLNDNGSSNLGTITWTSANLGTLDLQIYLVDGAGNYLKQIADNVPNTGSYAWASDPTIPNGNYKIDISSDDKGPSASDNSNSFFQITGSPLGTASNPSLIVEVPQAGSGYTEGGGMSVAWNERGVTPKNVQIYLSGRINAPITLASLGASAAQTWNGTTPNNLPADTNYVISVCDEGVQSPTISAKPLCGTSAVFSIAPQLNIIENPAFGSGSVIAGTASIKIGSYVIYAPNTEAIQMKNISINDGANASLFQNFRLVVGGTQFGNTQPSPSQNQNFFGSVFIPAGGSAVADVYADVLSNAPGGSQNTTGIYAYGVGQSSGVPYTSSGSGNYGQTMTITNAGTTQPCPAWGCGPVPTPIVSQNPTISPSSLSFTAQQGGANPVGQTLTFSPNLPTGWQISWNCNSVINGSVNCGWIKVGPNTSGANFISATLTPNISGLSAGTYSGSLSIINSSLSTYQSIPVTLTVTALTSVPQQGAISISGISSGETITAGQPIAFGCAIAPTGRFDIQYVLVPQGSTPLKSPGNGSFYNSSLGGYAIGGFSPSGSINSCTSAGAVTIPSDIPAGSYELRLSLLPSGSISLGLIAPQYAFSWSSSVNFAVIAPPTITPCPALGCGPVVTPVHVFTQ